MFLRTLHLPLKCMEQAQIGVNCEWWTAWLWFFDAVDNTDVGEHVLIYEYAVNLSGDLHSHHEHEVTTEPELQSRSLLECCMSLVDLLGSPQLDWLDYRCISNGALMPKLRKAFDSLSVSRQCARAPGSLDSPTMAINISVSNPLWQVSKSVTSIIQIIRTHIAVYKKHPLRSALAFKPRSLK
jgi:hypothetical protein